MSLAKPETDGGHRKSHQVNDTVTTDCSSGSSGGAGGGFIPP